MENLNIYGISYLLLPNVPEEQILAKVGALKDSLQKEGGAIISDENPVLIDLAYPMTKVAGTIRHKVKSGYFGWVKFEIGKEGIEAIKKQLYLNDEIVRYLIIKTVRENTLLNGKMIFKKEEKIKKEDAETTEEVLDETVKESLSEDIDKSIDDLVIV